MAVTLKDVAKETGLSVATISKYINGQKLKYNNRIIVEKAINKLNYSVNEYARGLKSNRSKTIGVIIPELCNTFVTQIISVMEEILRQNGYSVVVCDSHSNEKLECDAADFLMSRMIDGIINFPVCADGRHLSSAVKKKLPIVLVDRALPSLSKYADCVLIDNAIVSEKAVLNLLENGHRNIGIILGPKDFYTSQCRFEGYINAFRAYDLKIDDKYVIFSDHSLTGGHDSFIELKRRNPEMTAVFSTNYEMTLGTIIAANESMMQVPNDISLIGFDSMELSLITKPKLTIVTQPVAEIGKQAARILLDRLQQKTQSPTVCYTLSAALELGASVAKIN